MVSWSSMSESTESDDRQPGVRGVRGLRVAIERGHLAVLVRRRPDEADGSSLGLLIAGRTETSRWRFASSAAVRDRSDAL